MSQQLNDTLAGGALSRLSQKLPDRFLIKGERVIDRFNHAPCPTQYRHLSGEFMTEAINGSYVERSIVQSPFFPCGMIDHRKGASSLV